MKKRQPANIKITKPDTLRSPEIASGLVKIAHKISSVSNIAQVVKIGDKYFRVRELG